MWQNLLHDDPLPLIRPHTPPAPHNSPDAHRQVNAAGVSHPSSGLAAARAAVQAVHAERR